MCETIKEGLSLMGDTEFNKLYEDLYYYAFEYDSDRRRFKEFVEGLKNNIKKLSENSKIECSEWGNIK
jgi:hypothetical protein